MRQKKQSSAGEKKTCKPGSSEEQRHGDGTDWLYERKCPQCGKRFCMPNKEMWVYKDGDRVLCSWHCLREREKNAKAAAVPRKSKAGKIRLNPAQKAWMMQMIEQGLSTIEIERKLGVSNQVVWYYRRKAKGKKG